MSYIGFLILLYRGESYPHFPNDKPLAEISSVPNHIFLQRSNDCKNLDASFRFHFVKVLAKHIKCLTPFKKSASNCIDHRYVKELSQKSQFCVLDLPNVSENKMEAISILKHIHNDYILHIEDNSPSIIRKIVFGGDVLTNERANSAQLAMLNGQSDHFRLSEVVHRPEGLHRMMTFLLLLLMLSC